MMRTIAGAVRSDVEIRRSRFLAHAAPVRNETDTRAFFKSVADPGANHNCWAWRLDEQYRFHDDGEPAGTAGRPIMSVLEARDLYRVMVVVTRWFGGIKLGAGGLVRAYAGAASRALDQARLEPIVRMVTGRLHAPFQDSDVVHQCLGQFGARSLEERFDSDGSQLRFEIPANRFAEFRARLRDASSGRIRVQKTGGAG